MSTKVIETNVADWKKPSSGHTIEVADGLFLDQRQQEAMCRYYGLPGVLPKVDASHNTTVVQTVMQATTNEPVKILVDEKTNKVYSVIDPRSNFITDEQFEEMKKRFADQGFAPVTDLPHYRPTAIGETWFEVNLPGTSEVLGDAIRKTIQVERMPEGGCHLSAGIVRQICTNGAIVKEKDMTQLSRLRPFGDESIATYTKNVGAWDLEKYLHDKWFRDGQPIEASVGDYYGMRSLLLKSTDKETADASFPTEPITEFYKSQNIDLSTINNNLRNRIPSGLSYYDCFNILTHGMKQVAERTLAQDIEIAAWGFGHHIRGVRMTDLAVRGKPQFDPRQIRILRGDKVAA